MTTKNWREVKATREKVEEELEGKFAELQRLAHECVDEMFDVKVRYLPDGAMEEPLALAMTENWHEEYQVRIAAKDRKIASLEGELAKLREQVKSGRVEVTII